MNLLIVHIRNDVEKVSDPTGLINSEVDDFDDLIRVLAKELNMAIIIVEHRSELLYTIADRVMVMDAGEKISEGDLGMVLKDPRVRAAYFEDVH